MNEADSSRMTHQYTPLMGSDKTNNIKRSSSPSSSSSSSAEGQSQEHMRMLMEASDSGKKQSMTTSTEEQEQELQEQEQEHDQEQAEKGSGDNGGGGRGEDSGRERMRRHRSEVAGRVWVPEIWGQEELLRDWIDCSTFDSCLVPNGISSARAALVQEARRASSNGGLRLENRCFILH